MPKKRETVRKASAHDMEAVMAKMTEDHVWLRVLFRMGKLPAARLKKIIAKETENHGGRVLDRQSLSEGFGQKNSLTDLEFRNAAAATTCAFQIYRSATEVADCSEWPQFYVQNQELKIPERRCRDSGTAAMIVRLVDRHFDDYRQRGGKLGRVPFLEGCLGISGGVDRIYVEEGMTPSWQQLGAWFYEKADPGSTG